MIMGIGHNGGSREGGGREGEGLKGGSFLKGWTRGGSRVGGGQSHDKGGSFLKRSHDSIYHGNIHRPFDSD